MSDASLSSLGAAGTPGLRAVEARSSASVRSMLCEPCSHLEKMTRPGIIKELAHRAGINADILVGGVIRVGDPVVEL